MIPCGPDADGKFADPGGVASEEIKLLIVGLKTAAIPDSEVEARFGLQGKGAPCDVTAKAGVETAKDVFGFVSTAKGTSGKEAVIIAGGGGLGREERGEGGAEEHAQYAGKG